MTRIIPVVICLALAAGACGVSRDADPGAVLAADADQAAQDSAAGDAPVVTPTTLASSPPTTAPADDVALTAAFDDGMFEITHGQMNEVAVPTTEHEEFVALAFGGVRPPSFEVGVLTEQLVAKALELELAEAGVEVSEADLDSSRELLINQLIGMFSASGDPMVEARRLYDEVPYLQFLVGYQAGQQALTAAVAEGAEPTDGDPCVSHILVETESEAKVVLKRLAEGEDFADLAVELSTGPSGPGGGDLGCAASSGYVVPFAQAVDAAEIGEHVGPVQTDFGFHVLVVNRYEFDGRAEAAERLRQRLGQAEIQVDERLGSWDDVQLTIIPAPAS